MFTKTIPKKVTRSRRIARIWSCLPGNSVIKNGSFLWVGVMHKDPLFFGGCVLNHQELNDWKKIKMIYKKIKVGSILSKISTE